MASWLWILISLLALLILAVVLVWLRWSDRRPRLTPLASIAFACIILGIMFDDRILAYTLFGAGIVVAVVDIFVQRRKQVRGED